MPTLTDKVNFLKDLGTKSLIDRLPACENELEDKLRQESEFKHRNTEYLGTGDCSKVKQLMAELAVQIPELDEKGNKLSNKEARDAWLERQRSNNLEIAEAIQNQREVSFQIENHRIAIEIAKKRLEGLHAILSLRTAQLNFLS